MKNFKFSSPFSAKSSFGIMMTVKVRGPEGKIFKFPVNNDRIEASDLKKYLPGATALTFTDDEGCLNTVRSQGGEILLPPCYVKIFDAYYPGKNNVQVNECIIFSISKRLCILQALNQLE